MKNHQIRPKRAWGEYLHPTGTLLSVGPKSEISLFFTSEPAIKIFEMCHMGPPSPQSSRSVARFTSKMTGTATL